MFFSKIDKNYFHIAHNADDHFNSSFLGYIYR